jgi:hypothetical protein
VDVSAELYRGGTSEEANKIYSRYHEALIMTCPPIGTRLRETLRRNLPEMTVTFSDSMEVNMYIYKSTISENDGLRGWANYFALGPVEDAYRAIESCVTRRLRRWLCIKHKIRGSGCYRFTDQYLHDTLGLVRIRDLVRHLPWANA